MNLMLYQSQDRLRLKFQLMKDKKLPRKQTLDLNKEELQDLELRSLLQVHHGNSFNGLNLRDPWQLRFSDSCPRDPGGYTHTGRAWCLFVDWSTNIYNCNGCNNVLKFLGMVVILWLSLKQCKEIDIKDKLILCLGYNTSAIAWMFKSYLPWYLFYYKSVRFVARKVDTIVFKSDQFIVTQHIPRKRNIILDWLTFTGKDRKDHKGNIKTNQIAFNKLPNDIVSDRIRSIPASSFCKGSKYPMCQKKYYISHSAQRKLSNCLDLEGMGVLL